MSGSPTPTKKEPQKGSPGWVRFEEDEEGSDVPVKEKPTNGTAEPVEVNKKIHIKAICSYSQQIFVHVTFYIPVCRGTNGWGITLICLII